MSTIRLGICFCRFFYILDSIFIDFLHLLFDFLSIFYIFIRFFIDFLHFYSIFYRIFTFWLDFLSIYYIFIRFFIDFLHFDSIFMVCLGLLVCVKTKRVFYISLDFVTFSRLTWPDIGPYLNAASFGVKWSLSWHIFLCPSREVSWSEKSVFS